eukprot:363793-Chlamydomonas_euryale.AAC.6
MLPLSHTAAPPSISVHPICCARLVLDVHMIDEERIAPRALPPIVTVTASLGFPDASTFKLLATNNHFAKSTIEQTCEQLNSAPRLLVA